MSKPTTIKPSDPAPSKLPARLRRPARVDVGAAKTARGSAKRSAAPTTATKPDSRTPAASTGASKGVQRPIKGSSKAPPGTRKRPFEKENGIKRISALDAAAQVLARLSKGESKSGISAPDLVERMAKARLWSSPGGRTPAATLYAAMIREAAKKGRASRFIRVSPGRFAANRATSGGKAAS